MRSFITGLSVNEMRKSFLHRKLPDSFRMKNFEWQNTKPLIYYNFVGNDILKLCDYSLDSTMILK